MHICVISLGCCSKLEEIWVEDLENFTDKKVNEECLPGKPLSVFTNTSPKVKLKKSC